MAYIRSHICPGNPLLQFEKWLEDAINSEVQEPTAMSVVTTGKDGFPQSRIVLLKFFNEKGFVFFTNYESEKGISLISNPAAGLHFFWPELERQIRILGYAEKTEPKISDKYFYSRPLLSQISAIVSRQSSEIPSRKFLEDQVKEQQKTMESKTIKRPENWGGFRLKPLKIEFWQGRENRLHDRILYRKQNEEWKISRLAP